jgi:N-acetyl-anhydromuramyl-L-alanine amidase AmpD
MAMSNDTSIEDNKRLVRKFCEHFKTSNADGLIDAMAEDATGGLTASLTCFRLRA